MSRPTNFQAPQSRAGSLPVNELPTAQPRRAASSSSRQAISKDELYKQWGDEFKENPVLSKHTPGFSIERQIQRDQRAKSMCRIADRTFHALSYDPKYNVMDRHETRIDLRKHTGRKFDQSAGFFTPVGAHLSYHPERSDEYLKMSMKGNVQFGKLPARTTPQERQRAKYFEDAIVRRKYMWLHPSLAKKEMEMEKQQQQQQTQIPLRSSSSALPNSSSSRRGRPISGNPFTKEDYDFYEKPCPVDKLSPEQKKEAASPQVFFRSVRKTELAHKMSGSEVDATCGSPEVLRAAISNHFFERNKGHIMAGDCTREQRARSGYEAGKELPLSSQMAPLAVRYSGLGGKGFEKYVPIGEMPKTQITFGKSKKLQLERKDRDAIARTNVKGNSEIEGNPVKAFDATKRKLFRNISFGPGFKSKNEDDY